LFVDFRYQLSLRSNIQTSRISFCPAVGSATIEERLKVVDDSLPVGLTVIKGVTKDANSIFNDF